MKPLIIFHSPCADGFGAAWVAWTCFGGNIEMWPTGYDRTPPDVRGREVFVLDFSYRRQVLEEIAGQAASVTVLDHHKTAMEDLMPLLDAGVIRGEFNMDRSGAMMAWSHFFPTRPAPDLIRHIQDRDLYRFEIKGTREVSLALQSYPFDMDLWTEFATEAGTEVLRVEGAPLLRYHNKLSIELAELARDGEFLGYAVPIANVPAQFASDVGHILCSERPFSVTYQDINGGRMYSLRSDKKGEDVSAIAARIGGGGHKHAAGVRIPLDINSEEWRVA